MKFMSVGCFCWLWQMHIISGTRGFWRVHGAPCSTTGSHSAALPASSILVIPFSDIKKITWAIQTWVLRWWRWFWFLHWIKHQVPRFGWACCRVQLIHPAEQQQANCTSCCQHEGLEGRTRAIRSIWLLLTLGHRTLLKENVLWEMQRVVVHWGREMS